MDASFQYVPFTFIKTISPIWQTLAEMSPLSNSCFLNQSIENLLRHYMKIEDNTNITEMNGMVPISLYLFMAAFFSMIFLPYISSYALR